MAWFRQRNSSLLWNFNFKLHMHVDGGHRQKPIDFQRRHFQNGRLVAILEFFGFQTLTLVWLWISTPNLSGTILMYMCRSLLIFSNVNFKMAARQPYWIFWFPDSNFSLALNINSKLKWHNTYIYGQEPIDFQRCHFQNGRLVAMLDFLVSGLTLVWLWISTPNFNGKILMYIGKSLLIFSDLIFLMAAWWPY